MIFIWLFKNNTWMLTFEAVGGRVTVHHNFDYCTKIGPPGYWLREYWTSLICALLFAVFLNHPFAPLRIQKSIFWDTSHTLPTHCKGICVFSTNFCKCGKVLAIITAIMYFVIYYHFKIQMYERWNYFPWSRRTIHIKESIFKMSLSSISVQLSLV